MPTQEDRLQRINPIVAEAQRRFKIVADEESYTRRLFVDDFKFANADADNGYQWTNDLRKNRDVMEKPSLTINQTDVRCTKIINDIKQSRPGMTARPVGNGATYESAQVWKGLFRHIEYQSNAPVVYGTAAEFQVISGIGWWRVVTEYADHEEFTQEIYLRRVPDPLTVFMDPDIKEKDGSDARYAFIIQDVPKDLFEQKFPEYKDLGTQPLIGITDWNTKDHVRVAEYFSRTQKKDMLYSILDSQTGQRKTLRASETPKELIAAIKDDPQTRKRETVKESVKWYLIIGDTIADETEWAGKYIPLVRVVGKEMRIDGKIDRRGHARSMKDPQRMYNYWASSATESVALQTKTPFIGAKKAFEGNETFWEEANRQNVPFLPFNHVDDDGNPIPPPQRLDPPQMAAAYVQGMTIARQDLMSVTGQAEASMGEQGNERTGAAINAHSAQGDNATAHFAENLGIGIVFTGKILLDLIPKIYDTERVIKILADDGEDLDVKIDPSAKEAYTQKLSQEGEVTERILNPSLGQYAVHADSGPSFQSKRQEAFQAFTLMLTQNPNLASVIGDLMMKAGDFPMADEAAVRLRRLVPKEALGQGPTAQEKQLQEMVQNLQAALAEVVDQLGQEKNKSRSKDQLRDIDAYKAETDRIKAFSDQLAQNQTEMHALLQQLVDQTMKTSLDPVLQSATQGLKDDISPGGGDSPQQTPIPGQGQPPIPGAQLAQDGKWYLKDPNGSGKYLEVGIG